jgi:hypothetical protein
MADAPDSKSGALMGVRVRLPPPAPPHLQLRLALGGRGEENSSGSPARGVEWLLVTQGFDGVEAGGLSGRIDAEEDPDQDRKSEGHRHGP